MAVWSLGPLRMQSHSSETYQKGDLGLRLISAAIMIPIGLFVVWKGGVYLAVGCGIFAALMAYEWVRITASPSMKPFVVLAVLPFLVLPFFGFAAAFFTIVVCALAALFTHPSQAKKSTEAFGMLYVTSMPLALYVLRDGAWDGAAAALIFMGIVWGSDSAAYFSGRGFGGPSLHPDSPSKTWSGAVGAIIFSSLCGLLAARITGGDQTAWLLTGAMISFLAQVGDLFESSIKRYHGVKDASGLLPGHGGLLDRVDGLGLVCIITVLVFLSVPSVSNILGLAV